MQGEKYLAFVLTGHWIVCDFSHYLFFNAVNNFISSSVSVDIVSWNSQVEQIVQEMEKSDLLHTSGGAAAAIFRSSSKKKMSKGMAGTVIGLSNYFREITLFTLLQMKCWKMPSDSSPNMWPTKPWQKLQNHSGMYCVNSLLVDILFVNLSFSIIFFTKEKICGQEFSQASYF